MGQFDELWEPCQEFSYLERSGTHISPGARSMECIWQLERWATMWSVDWQSGQVGTWPSPRSGGRTGASSSSQNGAGRGRCGRTEAAFPLNWRGSGHEHLVGRLGPDDLSSGLVGSVWVRDKHPLPSRHQRKGEWRWGRPFLLGSLLKCGGMRLGGWP